MELDAAKEIINYAKRPNAIRLGASGGDFAHLRIYDVTDNNLPSTANTVNGKIADMTCTGVALGDIVLGISCTTALTAGTGLVGHVTAANTISGAYCNGAATTVDEASTLDFKVCVLDLA